MTEFTWQATMSNGDVEQLARWRTLGARHSEEVVKLGRAVLESGRLGDQGVLTHGDPKWEPVLPTLNRRWVQQNGLYASNSQ